MDADPTVKIRPHYNDSRIGTVHLSKIEPRWQSASGGGTPPMGQQTSFIQAYVWCNEIEGEIGHSCERGPPPHLIKVCIFEKDNAQKIFGNLKALARSKPSLKLGII